MTTLAKVFNSDPEPVPRQNTTMTMSYQHETASTFAGAESPQEAQASEASAPFRRNQPKSGVMILVRKRARSTSSVAAS